MQKRLFFTILVAFFALASMAEGLTYLSTEDFKKKVCFYELTSGQQPQWKYIGDKPCLIDFSTTWCGWCKKLHPILEQVAKQYEGKVYVYTLDAEKELKWLRCLVCAVILLWSSALWKVVHALPKVTMNLTTGKKPSNKFSV